MKNRLGSWLCSALLLLTFNTFAYDFVDTAGQFSPPPPWATLPEPYETIDLQASENISGDVITIETTPPLEVGDTVTFSLDNGATFSDAAYVLEQWAGGAGTSDLGYATLQTGAPAGSADIVFLMQDSGGNPINAAVAFTLSGSALAGQSSNFNLPGLPGVDITLTATVRDAGNALRGSTSIVLFQSNLEPPPASIPTLPLWLLGIMVAMIGLLGARAKYVHYRS
jgi:hypothetical protein